MRYLDNRDGIMLVDKPAGMTSHDVVDFIRKEAGFKKVGHAGTLDPMATGLLILLVGSFTRKSGAFMDYDKEYEAVLCLGVSTDTGDREGSIVKKGNVDSGIQNSANIKNAFNSFKGEIEQVPPMYSAKKIKGKKLYEFARKGFILERKPKKILINEISVKEISLPYVSFSVSCSKGTYVRQLAHDIGEALGCGAHLASLRRTKIGPFDIKNAVSFGRLSTASIYENILRI